MRWIVYTLFLLLTLPTAGIARERLAIPSGDREPANLTAWLEKPVGTGPFAAVVLLHGCGGMYTRTGEINDRHLQWEKALITEGYAVLHLDSFGSRGIRQICTVKERIIRASGDRRLDAYAALSYLRTRPEIDPARIALMGWSNGGSTLMAAMERDKRTPTPSFKAAVAFYPGCRPNVRRSYDPEGPLLMLHGADDDWTPPARCQEMVAALRAKGTVIEAVEYPGAYHDFDWPGHPLRVRQGVRTDSGTAKAGTNEPARLDALSRVPTFLRRHL
ncbi:dienelactone hydrolase family protein [Lacibacterium aquatile]|uniref:Dienelactone hydrolase family protein n=1 Tax=Lacibacterium aquatile TaxID=1168082 RepID=A0ABW5DM96_9PROT